jgi:hypothetical protein
MVRVVTKIGEVFAVRLDDDSCKYFQYVANDLTQLNSDVIRAFKATQPILQKPDFPEILRGEVDFYAHCAVNLGVKLNLWEKVGRVADVGRVDVLFRGTRDYGWRPGEEVRVSHNWYIWRVNEPRRDVGELLGAHREAEIGLVMSPYDIVERMRTGEYGGVYPGYQ